MICHFLVLLSSLLTLGTYPIAKWWIVPAFPIYSGTSAASLWASAAFDRSDC